jgi:hypothetical protein
MIAPFVASFVCSHPLLTLQRQDVSKKSPTRYLKKRQSSGNPKKCHCLVLLSAFAMLTIAILLLAVFQSSHLDTPVVVTSQKQRLASFASGKSKRKEEKLSQKEDGAPNDNYKLAHEQSLGYFDDISEENWIRAQQIHAKLFPNHFSKTLRKYSNGPHDKGHRNPDPGLLNPF